jgi:RNA polymerase sigma factor (sigma-70 family)
MWEPETRPSLMVRLRAPQDQQAWAEFVSIYQPLILRVMRGRGLQEADAQDVAQQVVLVVTKAVERWQPDGKEASFRRWLFSIAHRLALRFIQRGYPKSGVGGTDMLNLLDSLPDSPSDASDEFNDEYRNEVFRWAADRVRGEFRESTWQAFWRTCVLNESIADVADRLGMSTGSIYVARSRIIARLRVIVEQFESDHGT